MTGSFQFIVATKINEKAFLAARFFYNNSQFCDLNGLATSIVLLLI